MTSFFNKAALLAVTAVAFATPSFAQSTSVTANGKATVKLYTPLSIAADVTAGDTVDFGVLVGSTAGPTARGDATFTVAAGDNTPTAAEVCTAGALAANWSCGGTPKRAGFVVNGGAGALVSLQLSAPTIVLTRAGAPATPAASDLLTMDLLLTESDVSSPADSVIDMSLDGSGTNTVYVGGDLNVAAANVDGVYNGTFTLTADYQ